MQSRIPVISIVVASLSLISEAGAQTQQFAQPQARILNRVDDSARVTLTGNVHPVAAAATSTQADPGTAMDHMILYLKGDATQEAQLTQLIAQQHDPKSPLYHKYLTPQTFGAQFGVAAADISKVTAWLESKGFHVEETAASNRALVFSGTSFQVQDAFKTQIRAYAVGGVTRIANASDPQIPAALASTVGGIVKLHNFQHTANISKSAAVTSAQLSSPQYNYGTGHYLSPADYSTIYNINPLYTSGINGTGQTIAVIARSNIYMSDMQTFRSQFGLKANNPTVILTGSDPGVLQGDSFETTLDAQWAGAIAPNAAIKIIVSASTYTADGIDLASMYAVNHNVAPVLSLSYGSCEASMGTSEVSFYNSLWQQAAAQGQTVMVSSGDSGAAGCNSGSATSGSGQGVNGLCTSPYATCVGGTQFVEGSNPGQYWLPGNNSTYGSAISYIPETVWNESGSSGGSGLWSGGGGASIAFAKPSWQVGLGVPADGKRDVPDVSLTAAGHDGYLIIYGGGLNSVGGTSASAPAFAGLMALVNQKTNVRVGVANTVFYPLAAAQNSGGATVFHDTVSGSNSVPGVAGFGATAGYDRASGLGSVDANALINHWQDGTTTTTPDALTLSASVSPLTVKVGQTGQTTVTSKTNLNFKSAVTLAISGVPSGVTATFSTTALASPGSGTSVLSLAVGSSATPGSYSLTVTGSATSQVAKLSITLVIPAPTFTLSASAASINILTGAKGTAGFSTSPQNGFSANIALSATGLPAGVTAAFSPASITGSTGGSTTLTLNVAATAKTGTYVLTVSAVGGGVTQTSNLTLMVTVPARCTFGSSPATLSVNAGETTSAQLSCSSPTGTFNGPITVTVTGAPGGVAAQLSPNTLTPGSTTTLAITSSLTALSGSYNLSLTASGSGYTQSITLPLTVAAVKTFTLSTGQSTVTVRAGASGQATVVTSLFGGYNNPIAFAVSGLPAGATASFSSATLPAPGSGTVSVNFTSTSTVRPGIYPILVTGTGGGVTKTTNVNLTVVANQDFTLAISTTSLSMPQNGAGSVIVSTGNFTGGFNSTITITFSGLAPGMNWGVIGATTGNNMVNITDRFTAASFAPVGTYPITITASGAGIIHTAVVMVTITKAGTAASR